MNNLENVAAEYILEGLAEESKHKSPNLIMDWLILYGNLLTCARARFELEQDEIAWNDQEPVCGIGFTVEEQEAME